jgi:hypothetical protein
MNQLATVESDVQATGDSEAITEPSGLGCLVIIARHHGLDLSVSQLAEQRKGDSRELLVAELTNVAKSVGLQARSLRPDCCAPEGVAGPGHLEERPLHGADAARAR